MVPLGILAGLSCTLLSSSFRTRFVFSQALLGAAFIIMYLCIGHMTCQHDMPAEQVKYSANPLLLPVNPPQAGV